MKGNLALPWREIWLYHGISYIQLEGRHSSFTQTMMYTNSITHRWLLEWNINIAGERRLCKHTQSVVTTNLKGEAVPLHFL